MISKEERELLKRRIEEFELIGFKKVQIAQILKINRHSVGKLSKEITKERLEKNKKKPELTLEILSSFKRLLEESWCNYFNNPQNKAQALRTILLILSGYTNRIMMLGYFNEFMNENKEKIEEQKISETEIFNYLNKLASEQLKNRDKTLQTT